MNLKFLEDVEFLKNLKKLISLSIGVFYFSVIVASLYFIDRTPTIIDYEIRTLAELTLIVLMVVSFGPCVKSFLEVID